MLESAIGITGNSQFILEAEMCQALWKELNSRGNWQVFKNGYPCSPSQVAVAVRITLHVVRAL